MEKLKNYKSFLILFCMLSIASCYKDDSSLQSSSLLENASEMAKLHDGELSKSSILFSSAQGADMQAKMSMENGGMQIFTFQRDPNDVSSTMPQDGKYEVLYMRHFIVLNDLKSGQKFILIVSKQESTDLLKKLPASYTKNVRILSGYGLSMNYAAGAKVLDCASAGGSGATSCSNTCCSVSCASGYQASCGSQCRCDRKL